LLKTTETPSELELTTLRALRSDAGGATE
jgi:hypothetical protein